MNGSHFKDGQGALIASVLFSVLGLAMMGQGLMTGLRARDSENWPQCAGIVVESRLISEKDRHNGEMTQRPVLTYQFSPDPKTTNHSHRVEFSPRKIHGAHAREWVERYPTGMPVTVYYHPNDSSVSVLIPGTQESTWFSFKAGAAVLALGVLCLGIYFFKEKYRKQRPLPTSPPSLD